MINDSSKKTWKSKIFSHVFEIRDVSIKHKRNKTAGYDDIPTSLIIDGATKITGLLSLLISRWLEMAIFPSS